MTVGSSVTTYNWGYEDRLTSISGTSAYNIYNGLDMRVSRAGTGGTLFNYLCDGADPASPVLKDGYFVYTQGIGQTSTGGNVLTYILDRLGDSTRVMDSTQSITDTQVFDAFGNSVSRTGTTWPMPFGFVAKSGYQTDQDTGLQLLGHRFYDPTIGRFLSRDPIHAGTNDYAYCGNEPVGTVDPTGEVMFGIDGRGDNADVSGGDDDDLLDDEKEVSQRGPNVICWSVKSGSGAGGDPVATSSTASDQKQDTGPAKSRLVDKNKRMSSKALRRQYEKDTGEKVPKEPNGRNYDMHHKTAKADGGEDETSNLEPLKHSDHVQNHTNNGDYKRWGSRRYGRESVGPEEGEGSEAGAGEAGGGGGSEGVGEGAA